jgi:hypothetical protein
LISHRVAWFNINKILSSCPSFAWLRTLGSSASSYERTVIRFLCREAELPDVRAQAELGHERIIMNDDFKISVTAASDPELPTMGMSSVYRLFEAFIALREKNQLQLLRRRYAEGLSATAPGHPR